MQIFDKFTRRYPRPTDRLLKDIIRNFKSISTDIISKVASDLMYVDQLNVDEYNIRRDIVVDKNGNPQVIIRLKSTDKTALQDIKEHINFFNVYNYVINRTMETLSYGIRMEATMGHEAYLSWKNVVKESVEAHVGVILYIIDEKKAGRLEPEMIDVIKNMSEQQYPVFLERHGEKPDSESVNGFYRYARMVHGLFDPKNPENAFMYGSAGKTD